MDLQRAILSLSCSFNENYKGKFPIRKLQNVSGLEITVKDDLGAMREVLYSELLREIDVPEALSVGKVQVDLIALIVEVPQEVHY